MLEDLVGKVSKWTDLIILINIEDCSYNLQKFLYVENKTDLQVHQYKAPNYTDLLYIMHYEEVLPAGGHTVLEGPPLRLKG